MLFFPLLDVLALLELPPPFELGPRTVLDEPFPLVSADGFDDDETICDIIDGGESLSDKEPPPLALCTCPFVFDDLARGPFFFPAARLLEATPSTPSASPFHPSRLEPASG